MGHQTRRTAIAAAAATALLAALGHRRTPAAAATTTSYPVHHTDAEWRALLSPAAFAVLRRQGTEWPGSSPLLHVAGRGRFRCAGCARPLFDAATKFDSFTGWPSFWAPLPRAVQTRADSSLIAGERTEVHCSECGGHLGHLFPDGPRPTGLRYCMNGAALQFIPA